MKKILIVDDDPSLARTLEIYFQSKSYAVSVASNAAEAHELWEEQEPDLILLDVQLPDGDGPEVLARAKEQQLGGDVVMITAFQDTEATLAALQLGAVDYLYKPLDLDALDLLLEKILRHRRERDRMAQWSHVISEVHKANQIIGRSAAISGVIKAVAQVAKTPAMVLLEGETGTGKELIAQTIHQHSSPLEPFVAINCAAVVGGLLESELFGHEKGAFTGAVQRKMGKLELAGKGTVFLDEVGELPLELQAKLLRVLDAREFQRVGGLVSIPLLARIIAATNRDLMSMVQNGQFREDLYYRLKVFVIRIPPLRERPEDILSLAEYFLSRLNRELHKHVVRIPQLDVERLIHYKWPGNVRELYNVLRRAVILSEGETLELDEQWVRSEWSEKIGHGEQWEPKSLVEVEKEHIRRVLDYTDGNYGKACEILEISRPTLRKKIQDYGLEELL